MAKRTEKQKLIDKLDDLFQMCIRYRDNFTCITCGKKFPVGERIMCHAGHYIGRGTYSTRWDEENVNAQCAGCNLKQSKNDAEVWYKYEKALEAKYGKGTVERLLQKKHQIIKVNKAFLEDNIKIYKEALEEYKKNAQS
jgi:hypothetical protein